MTVMIRYRFELPPGPFDETLGRIQEAVARMDCLARRCSIQFTAAERATVTQFCTRLDEVYGRVVANPDAIESVEWWPPAGPGPVEAYTNDWRTRGDRRFLDALASFAGLPGELVARVNFDLTDRAQDDDPTHASCNGELLVCYDNLRPYQRGDLGLYLELSSKREVDDRAWVVAYMERLTELAVEFVELG